LKPQREVEQNKETTRLTFSPTAPSMVLPFSTAWSDPLQASLLHETRLLFSSEPMQILQTHLLSKKPRTLSPVSTRPIMLNIYLLLPRTRYLLTLQTCLYNPTDFLPYKNYLETF